MKKIYILALSALLLTACSGEEPAGNPDGEVAVRITAGINDALTRADGSVWEADRIGVTVTSSPKSDMAERYRNMPYSTTSNEAVAEFSAIGEEIYFQNREETVAFSAYAPYSELTGSDSSAEAAVAFSTEDQASRELQKKIDFIYAEGATASRGKPEVSFSEEAAFRHVMSRLVIEVRTSTDDGFRADEVFGGHYTLGGLAHSAVFKPFKGVVETSGEAIADWDLGTKTRSVSGTASKTFFAIVVPQTLAEPLKFKAELAGQVFLNETGIKPALESGKSYKYTITVRKTGLTVSGCTIADWTEGGNFSGDATMPMPNPQVGDYYYSDGTYSTILDPSKQTIGIVFYTGQHTDDKSDYTKPLTADGTYIRGGRVRGYAVALNDASAGGCMWGENYRELGCFPKDSDGNALDNASNPQIDWSGYEWTQKIIAAAGGIDRLNGSTPAGYPATYYTVVAYQNSVPAPEGSSGWFLPSVGQMTITGPQKDKIASVGGSPLAYSYQSSSEDYETPGYLILHAIISIGKPTYYTKENSDHPVRAIIAF